MCLAIYKPAGVEIPQDALIKGWAGNPDGAGFAYVSRGKIRPVKGLMKLADFLKAYKGAVEKYPDSPFLVHFRIRSLGDRSPENTHPFMFKYGCGIHNGTFNNCGAKFDQGKSDTALFFEKFGDNLPYKHVLAVKEDLEKAIGSWNKMVFLYKNSEYIILNESAGEWREGVWYSNRTYLPRPTTAPDYSGYAGHYDMID